MLLSGGSSGCTGAEDDRNVLVLLVQAVAGRESFVLWFCGLAVFLLPALFVGLRGVEATKTREWG